MDRERVLRQLDKMLASGRVTPEEVERLRSTDPNEFEGAVKAISTRHARERIEAALAAGQLTREAADAQIEKLGSGEHPDSSRSNLTS